MANKRLHRTMGILQRAEKDVKPLQAIWTKFNNDWSWNNAAGLAYNLILSIFPLLISFIALFGLFLGQLDPGAYKNLVGRIEAAFNIAPSSQGIIEVALNQLTRQSGILEIIFIILAIFNGSRMFLFLEGTLDIIYHVRPRGIIGQNIMAIGMLLIFIILIPIMIFASTVPTFVFSLLKQTSLNQIPDSSQIFSWGGIAVGIFSGLIAAYIFFQTIYIVVPNQKISFRHSWLGSLVSAVLLELYIILFPIYVAHFLASFAATLGLLVLLIFFYYFAMILYMGAEINAYAQGIHETPNDLTTMVHMMTSHLQTSEQDVQERAAADHKDEEPKKIHPKHEQDDGKNEQKASEI